MREKEREVEESLLLTPFFIELKALECKRFLKFSNNFQREKRNKKQRHNSFQVCLFGLFFGNKMYIDIETVKHQRHSSNAVRIYMD